MVQPERVYAVAKTKSKIDTREQRKKLTSSGKPYLETFERGLDLGYRKGQRGGSWVVRRYLGRERGYAYETIGRADDDPADNGALTYEAARLVARDRANAIAAQAHVASMGPVVTVATAIADYAAVRDAREIERHGGSDAKGVKHDARLRLSKHVPEALAAKALADLTADDLAEWRADLKVRSPQRVTNDLKAALNAAAKRHKRKLPSTIRDEIKDGLATVTVSSPVGRQAQVMLDADVRRIISAAREVDAEGGWDGDLARLVIALAATGARFSQIIRMRVCDVQTAGLRLMVPASRKGRSAEDKPPVAVPVGADVIASLAPVTNGRKGHETLFPSTALATDRTGEMGEGRARTLVRGSRANAPVGCDHLKGGLGARNGPLRAEAQQHRPGPSREPAGSPCRGGA